MEGKPFTNVADLSREQRLAVESMVGHPLDSEDMLFLVVMRPGQEPTAADKARARARLETLFEQIDHSAAERGITGEDADAAIDDAVRDVRARWVA
jgi:hypothetical protein